jgi:hypothetical protein
MTDIVVSAPTPLEITAATPANDMVLTTYLAGPQGPAGPAISSFTVATLPSAASNTGRVIYISDEVGGARLAFSNGTSWLRLAIAA